MAVVARASRVRRRRLRAMRSLRHGAAFYRAAAAFGPRAPHGGERPRLGRTWMRVRAGLVLEVGDDPDGRAPPVSEREKRRARGLAGPGEKLAGWGSWEKGRGEERPAGLGPQGRKERGKGEKESGSGPKRKISRKRIALKCI
jgi:hypothetical protein